VARTRLRAWFYRMQQANLQALTVLAAPIRRWRPWRANVIHAQIPNGVTEGVNTKIKLWKRMAYGLERMLPNSM
jgi:transposase